MKRLFFEYEITSQGAILRLMHKPILRRPQAVPVDRWAEQVAEQAFSGVSRVLALLEDTESAVERTNDGLFLDHATIAALTEPQALGLGLPPATPFFLQVETENLITDPDFRVIARWIGDANRLMRTRRRGAFLVAEEREYRIPQPLYHLIEAIDRFQASNTSEQDTRLERLAHLQSLIPEEANSQLSVGSYFNSFRILHATAFSLRLTTDGGSFNFDPILFGRRVVERSHAETGTISEAEGLLTEHHQQVFESERFRSFGVARPSYVIERGIYVYLDPPLRDALTMVRQMQGADHETRRSFARSPQRFLKEALSESLSDDEVERLFIETEQYSERVVDIGIWTPPVLPWVKKDPNDWLPERFGLQIGDQYVTLTLDDIVPLRERIKTAIENGIGFVEFGEDRIKVPANLETDTALGSLLPIIRPANDEGDRTEGNSYAARDNGSPSEKRVLIVQENFDGVGFRRKVSPRSEADGGIPAAIHPALKKHQLSGLAWLQDTWKRGYPGVLLADDMGLGKTLQALAFLAWLREIGAAGKGNGRRSGPILIVAPTGLLANWMKEHDLHLHEPGLGEVCRAYGRHLSVLKSQGGCNGAHGAANLDHKRIQSADWVLTTYETLRDYHLSFAAIPFACVVFDEMQKVKSPTSLLTRTAKTVNADYVIGLTGTPIENQLTDLWCIFDIIDPGRLGDLRTFSATYKSDDLNALEELRKRLLEPTDEAPPPVLRRMKADHLDGLPNKRIHIRKRQMPEGQAKIYAEIVTKAKQPEAGPILETLHLLRGISLHPIWPPAGEIPDPESYIAASARLSETFQILDDIASKREKVLIFLESLDLQHHLALLIKKRYELPRLPMQINGEVTGEKRQRLVDNFQAERGKFDVMILSPRAGGVGLTLTSANHVIHLSRWWNPAVEDQCTDRIYRIGQDQTVHVYYPMAIHPLYGESSFDELLHTLLERKRNLSRRMLVPPVDLAADQKWFADNLGCPRVPIEPIDLADIDVMEPAMFERWVLGRSAMLGWEVAQTPRSHDGGADGLLFHRESGARAIVQCKHKQSIHATCGPDAIDDLLRARNNFGESARLFALTNASQFSRTAQDRAQRYGIRLIARDELRFWPHHLVFS